MSIILDVGFSELGQPQARLRQGIISYGQTWQISVVNLSRMANMVINQDKGA